MKNNQIKSSFHSFRYIIYLSVLIGALLISSCGSDNTTVNNNPGGETVLFSLDSLSINLINLNNYSIDTNILIANNPNIKITFECNTNVDSINSLSLYRLVVGDSISTYLDTLNNKVSQLNTNHTFEINASKYFSVNLFIQLNRLNSNYYFIKIKNFKILKNA